MSATVDPASASSPAPAAGVAGGVREVKSASRTVELLEFLAARPNRPGRLRELSEALAVPRSSLYALLRTLVKHGWVQTDATGMLYGIGIRALLTGTSYLDADPILRLVQPWLDRLKEQLDETVHFGRLDGCDIVYLATRESSQYLRTFSRVGRRLPAYTTALGKVLLAEHSGQQLDDLLPRILPEITPNTITNRKKLDSDLIATRDRGYAIDHEENTLGLRCFAFAIHSNMPSKDAISCSVPTARLTPKRADQIVAAMRHAQAEIEKSAAAFEGHADWAGFRAPDIGDLVVASAAV